jgi:hypothetical protein
MSNYKARQTIQLGKNTTEEDLYNLFGDAISKSTTKRNGMWNEKVYKWKK